jgi:hypothetical protein
VEKREAGFVVSDSSEDEAIGSEEAEEEEEEMKMQSAFTTKL